MKILKSQVTAGIEDKMFAKLQYVRDCTVMIVSKLPLP